MAKVQRKRIGLVFAGGTALSQKPKPWELVRTPAGMRRWLDNFPELHVVADVEPVFVTGKAANQIGAAEWLQLAQAVKQQLTRVDGFVILHGIETLHFTANALSLMLRSLPMPVVLSGSPLRIGVPRSGQVEFGARANIVNALEVATSDLNDVCVVFGNRIMRACKVQPELVDGQLHLTTVDGSVLGRVDFGTKLFFGRPFAAKRKPTFNIHLDPNVVVTTLLPGSSNIGIRQGLDAAAIHGVVIRASQDFLAVSPEVQRELEAAAEQGIPVVVTSSHKLRSLPKRLISLVGLSPSMAVVKVMWALGVTRDRTKLKQLLEANIAGEFTKELPPPA